MQPPDKHTPRRKAARAGYEVAAPSREPGRPPRRQLRQHRFDEVNDAGGSPASAHGDEPSHEHGAAPPRDDRAG